VVAQYEAELDAAFAQAREAGDLMVLTAVVRRWSGGRRESHPPAPADPGVTVSRHRALIILFTRLARPREPISSARTGGDTVR
jgi:hypothetical protein